MAGAPEWSLIVVVGRAGADPRVTVVGALDVCLSLVLLDVVDGVAGEPGVQRVVLDLGSVAYVSAGGLGVLVGIQTRLAAHGQVLMLEGVPVGMVGTLKLAGLGPSLGLARFDGRGGCHVVDVNRYRHCGVRAGRVPLSVRCA